MRCGHWTCWQQRRGRPAGGAHQLGLQCRACGACCHQRVFCGRPAGGVRARAACSAVQLAALALRAGTRGAALICGRRLLSAAARGSCRPFPSAAGRCCGPANGQNAQGNGGNARPCSCPCSAHLRLLRQLPAPAAACLVPCLLLLWLPGAEARSRGGSESHAAPPAPPAPPHTHTQRKKRTHVEPVADPSKKSDPRTFVFKRGKHAVREGRAGRASMHARTHAHTRRMQHCGQGVVHQGVLGLHARSSTTAHAGPAAAAAAARRPSSTTWRRTSAR